MPTLRELSLMARELEERGMVLQWLDTQLRTLVTGGTELRVGDQPVQASTVTAIMADIRDLLELNAKKLSGVMDQDLAPAKKAGGNGKEIDVNGIPSFEKPRRAQQGRKG